MTDHPPSSHPLVDVGHYRRLSQARERALVVSAMELPHWIVRDGAGFALRVEAPAEPAVLAELEKFEAEQHHRASTWSPDKPLPKLETLSLYVAAWILGATWLVQNLMPARWQESGAASSLAIVRDGEWWRALTALTLHGSVSHIAANVAFGLLFAAFVLPRFGTGLTWLLIVLSGLLGNIFNAWFYRGMAHVSIGASTAVFGALGLLVAGEFVARFSSHATRNRWHLLVPIGAGLALLALLGAGDEIERNTDYMAHLWGFVAGLLLGAGGAFLQMGEMTPRRLQYLAAVLAPALLVLAWWLAYARAR